MMQDSLQRRIRYLRLSLTPACPMRCVYCRPAALAAPDRAAQLTVDEIATLVGHLVQAHNLSKVRLTGGEPTTRPDLLPIVRVLAAVPGLNELALTTNGLTLAQQAPALVDAGLQRVNVSLDSLDPQGFARLTGVDGLARVLAGIDAAVKAGLTPVKLNCVVVRGHNDHELPALAAFAARQGLEIRFIELMPMGPLADQWAQLHVPALEMRQRLEALVTHWRALPRDAAAARRYRAELAGGGRATVGFVTAMSCPFCDRCDRLRIASDGRFYPCLMDRPVGSVLPALRPRFHEEELERILADGLRRKAPEHPAIGVAVMTHLGG